MHKMMIIMKGRVRLSELIKKIMIISIVTMNQQPLKVTTKRNKKRSNLKETKSKEEQN